MNLIYAKERINTMRLNIFLAGPTPRSLDVKSWRPEAIDVLKNLKFPGDVLIPEARNKFTWDYIAQIDWEEEGLIAADCIMFWIPRNMKTLPGLTTNVEWGAWHKSGKVVVGMPHNAEHVKYIKYYADKLNIPRSYTIVETIENAVKMVTKKFV